MKYAVFSGFTDDPALCTFGTYEKALEDFNERKADEYCDETDIYICEIISVREAK